MGIAPRNQRKIRVAALVGIAALTAGFALTALQANASEEADGETYGRRGRHGQNPSPPPAGGEQTPLPPAGGADPPPPPAGGEQTPLPPAGEEDPPPPPAGGAQTPLPPAGGETPEPPAEGQQVIGPAVVSTPDGTVLEATYQVREGFQLYECVSGTFSFTAPQAQLADAGGQTIQHGAGPSWQSNTDGSRVTGTLLTSSPRDNAIPELLLRVVDRSGAADSELGGIDFIQRLDTVGGLAPAGPCEDGVTAEIPYSATYHFWRIA